MATGSTDKRASEDEPQEPTPQPKTTVAITSRSSGSSWQKKTERNADSFQNTQNQNQNRHNRLYKYTIQRGTRLRLPRSFSPLPSAIFSVIFSHFLGRENLLSLSLSLSLYRACSFFFSLADLTQNSIVRV